MRTVWLGCGAVVGLLVVGLADVPRMFSHDPCDSALPFATEVGLHLSSDEEVVSCEWQPQFPDSSGRVTVRTESPASRDALLAGSGVSEEVERSLVVVNDGPVQEDERRPNLERGEQVYTATAANGHRLEISYDEGVESGLLLTVWAIQV